MLKSEYDALSDEMYKKPTVSMAEVGYGDRTLIYGYTCKRQTFHAYVKYDELYVVIFDGPEEFVRHGVELEAAHMVPDKRVYPQWCDYDFCKLLISKGVSIPFTTFTQPEEAAVQHKAKFTPYYGETLI